MGVRLRVREEDEGKVADGCDRLAAVAARASERGNRPREMGRAAKGAGLGKKKRAREKKKMAQRIFRKDFSKREKIKPSLNK